MSKARAQAGQEQQWPGRSPRLGGSLRLGESLEVASLQGGVLGLGFEEEPLTTQSYFTHFLKR